MEDGKYCPRGTVVEDSEIPTHLKRSNYLTKGIVKDTIFSDLDYIEVGEKLEEDNDSNSPMHELVLGDIEQGEVEEETEVEDVPKRRLRTRLH